MTQAGAIEEMVAAAEALLATLDDPAGSHAIRQFSISKIVRSAESCSATHGVSAHGRKAADTRPALPQLNIARRHVTVRVQHQGFVRSAHQLAIFKWHAESIDPG